MDLKWLKTFVVAAKTENFRKTAEELFVSQPTVTVHIRLLEDELGLRLFQRAGRRIVLTDAGRGFQKHANQLLEAYDHGLEEIRRQEQGFDKKLTIAVSPYIASAILPALLRTYMKKHPNVELNIQVQESKFISDALSSGAADIGLSRMFIQMKEIQCIALHDDPVRLIVPHDGYDPETGPPLDSDELFKQYILFIDNHPEYWEEILPVLRMYYPQMKTMAVSQVHVTKRFIEEGLGISFLPVSIVQRELVEGRLLEVETDCIPPVKATTYALLKNRNPEVEEFLQFISKFRI